MNIILISRPLNKIILGLAFACSALNHAQDFKPYKVKSGKIVYENIRYSRHSVFKSENGIETSFSEQIPYVSEEVVYFWDEFGDIAFEEIYKVSKFGGETLPEKVKIAERLWIDEHRYYFNIEKNKVSDDPYHLRIKCKEHFQYYQIKDSWIETLYMAVEKAGTESLLGKEAIYYKIDTFQDLYAWKGLVLLNESFATTRDGIRLYPDRTKKAVAIDTLFKIEEKIFDPIWLKREQLFKSFDGNKIGGVLDARQDLLVQVENIEGIELQKNDILLFVTTELNLGNMQILDIIEGKMTIKFTLYNNLNEIVHFNKSLNINNSLINIDDLLNEPEDSSHWDFKFEKNNIIPQNNIGIYLLKDSRTTSLKLKPYIRN